MKRYSITGEEIKKIKLYVEELKKWNKKINLVSKDDEIWIIEDLIIPVIIIRDWVDSGNVVEIGAGQGVVSIILNILNRNARFTLIERREKKCSFLRYVRKKLSLNYDVICKDARKGDFKEIYDFLILRGVKILDWHFDIARKIIYFGKIDEKKVIEERRYKNINISLIQGNF